MQYAVVVVVVVVVEVVVVVVVALHVVVVVGGRKSTMQRTSRRPAHLQLAATPMPLMIHDTGISDAQEACSCKVGR